MSTEEERKRGNLEAILKVVRIPLHTKIASLRTAIALTDGLTYWQTDRQTDRLAGWLAEWL